MEERNCPKYTKEQLHIFDDLPSGVLINLGDPVNGIRYAYSNPFLANYLGYTHEELEKLLQEDAYALIYEADCEKTRHVRESVLRGEIADSISRQKKKDGSFVWILAHVRSIEVDGRGGMIFLFSRIQELIGLQNELSKKSEEWEDIVQSVPIGLMVFKIEHGITTTLSINNPMLQLANSVGSQLDSKKREWSEAELSMIFNQDIYAFCENEDIPTIKEMMEESKTKEVTFCIFRLRGSSMGTPVYLFVTCASKEIGEDSRMYYVTYQNVTAAENQRLELMEKQKELIKKQTQLYDMSYYDALTGVKNRNAYNEYSEKTRLNRMRNVGFAFCDLNGLKLTNDTLGHYYGDQMIQRFTTILREYFDNESIYRLSGDEFVIILPNITKESFHKKMYVLLERIRNEENIASVGYIWKQSASDIQRRTAQAEKIMYVEKQRYYETSRAISSKHRPRFLESLLQEFENGRFLMYLQPKTSIDDSKVVGAEALARKINSAGKLVPPHEFVPQLEYEKLIPKLDFFMLEQVCQFLQKLHEQGKDDFSVSVNLSRVTIVENDFLEKVEVILNRYSFERKNLEFELTESVETMDSSRLEEYLLRLKALGAMIALDDVGTEYSSFPMLILNGVDWVKLDRSLIIQMEQARAKTLLKHIIRMSHDLNLKVIAEGVEKDAERITLMEMGCDSYQGYLKSKPIPVEEFEAEFL